jgi:glycosyltransferase involved in cell wall biosynthesis
MKPSITIIIPSYNREEHIFETLKSVLNQTYKNWECIIVDDGSSNFFVEIIKDFIKEDSRFKFFERPKYRTKGANACRNIGIKNAVGKYVIFLDSDDILKSDCLENRINYFKDNPEKDLIVFSMGYFINIKDGFYLDENRSFFNCSHEELLNEFIFGKKLPWNVTRPIFKIELLRKNHFNEQIHNFQDDEFNIRLIANLRPNYLSYDITDCYYRTDEISRNKYSNQLGYQNIINSLFEYYITVFEALIKTEKLCGKEALVLKFCNQINQFVVPNLNLKSLRKTLDLFDKQLKLDFIQYYSFYFLIFINYYFKEKKGYFFARKRIMFIINK